MLDHVISWVNTELGKWMVVTCGAILANSVIKKKSCKLQWNLLIRCAFWTHKQLIPNYLTIFGKQFKLNIACYECDTLLQIYEVHNHINLKNHTEQLTNSLGQETNIEVNKQWLYFSTRNRMCYNIQYTRFTVYNETSRKYKLLQNQLEQVLCYIYQIQHQRFEILPLTQFIFKKKKSVCKGEVRHMGKIKLRIQRVAWDFLLWCNRIIEFLQITINLITVI